MDKLIELCFRGIIQEINGDKELLKQYKELAMEEYKEHEDAIKFIYEDKTHKKHKGKKYKGKYTYRVEDITPKKIKKRLYELVN
ncbi:hypothetical protein [Tissierella praeacuta]|uniref:hypothetical protein n=1 Tax=Tissierella praeacuta TaxID=43131 RepID=UPI00333F749F